MLHTALHSVLHLLSVLFFLSALALLYTVFDGCVRSAYQVNRIRLSALFISDVCSYSDVHYLALRTAALVGEAYGLILCNLLILLANTNIPISDLHTQLTELVVQIYEVQCSQPSGYWGLCTTC